MRYIRIDDATWNRLKRWAEPLEDSPADALRRLLDYAERCRGLCTTAPVDATRGRRSGARLSRGRKLPQSEYYQPILESLYELGGRAPLGEVLTLVGQKLEAVFSDVDRQLLSSGKELRWRNTAQWARHVLIEQGLCRSDSPRGVWELTDAGVRLVETGKARGLAASSSMPATS